MGDQRYHALLPGSPAITRRSQLCFAALLRPARPDFRVRNDRIDVGRLKSKPRGTNANANRKTHAHSTAASYAATAPVISMKTKHTAQRGGFNLQLAFCSTAVC
jgi:hypothetical protein